MMMVRSNTNRNKERQERGLRRPLIEKFDRVDNDGDDALRSPMNASSSFDPSVPSLSSQSSHHCGGAPPPLAAAVVVTDAAANNDNGDDGTDVPPSLSRNSSRLLDRDGAFHQSKGHWGIHRVSQNGRLRRSSHQFADSRLRRWWNDWFHNLAYKPTLQLMAILFLLYTAQVFFFAFVYFWLSELGAHPADTSGFCGMDISNRMEALYFSLSTMTTIGYGVSDYYFGDCWTPLLLVLWQSCCAIAFQSIAIGLLFQRISRGQKRRKTIIFSDKAVVRRVKGVPHFMFRLGELRRHHLIDVVVRVYCLKHERVLVSKTGVSNTGRNAIETFHFMTRHIKLMHPDETLGSHILMSLPQVVVHKMDESSPLVPKHNVWYDANGQPRASSSSANENLSLFMEDREVEIVVQVEGTDESTAQPLQARHSYRYDDIAWDHTFVSCTQPFVTRDEDPGFWARRRRWRRGSLWGDGDGDPICSVDFAKFHDVVSARDAEFCPFVTE